jgi:hypothetical protein
MKKTFSRKSHHITMSTSQHWGSVVQVVDNQEGSQQQPQQDFVLPPLPATQTTVPRYRQQQQVGELLMPVGGKNAITRGADRITSQAYTVVRNMVTKQEFDSANWLKMVPIVMKYVNNIEGMTGLEKKAEVSEIVLLLLKEIHMQDSDRMLIMPIANTVINSAIDALYSAATGKLNLKASLVKTVESVTAAYNDDSVFQKVYSEIRGAIVNGSQYTAGNWIGMIPVVMAAVKRASNKKSGQEKKGLALALIRKLVSELPVRDPAEMATLELLADMTAPAAIDMAYDIAMGKHDIKKKVKKCFGSCCGK